jgi:hypothetical protein
LPVVPVLLEGTNNVISLPQESENALLTFPRRAQVTVRFGMPFRIDPTSTTQEMQQAIEKRMKQMTS